MEENWGCSISGDKYHIVQGNYALCNPQLPMHDTGFQPGKQHKCKTCLRIAKLQGMGRMNDGDL
jgi:hypothetical protein